MNTDLAHLLDRFSRARIVAVGDLVADEFVYGETERISREAPVLIVRYESAELKPGCGANAIMNLCALGARVQAIGLIGADEIGRRLRNQLVDAGADDSAIFIVDGPTSTKTRVLAGGKNTRRQQMLRIDRDGPAAPGAALAQKLVKALAQAAGKCDAIMVSDYGLGLLTPALVEAMRIANVAGALKVQKPGTVSVSAEELRAELARVEVAQPTLVMAPRTASRGRR